MPVPLVVGPARFRQIAWWALASQIGIVVTGATVRLTGSGLGCTDWPGCSEDRFVPEWSFHHWVEFGNRLVTFLVTATALAAIVGAWRRRPYRPALLWLAAGLLVGVAAQAAIGAVLVIFELDPRLTVLHFVVSMLLIADAVVLLHRAAADGALARPSIIGDPSLASHGLAPLPARLRRLVDLLGVAVLVLIGTGTVVTGSGPHGGDERADRFGFTLRHVAQIHAGAMWVFLTLLVILAALVLRADRPSTSGASHHWAIGDARHRLRANVVGLLALTAAQGVLGYLQYAMGVPPGLVALHVLGSTLVWTTTLALVLKARSGSVVGLRVRDHLPAGARPRPVLSKG